MRKYTRAVWVARKSHTLRDTESRYVIKCISPTCPRYGLLLYAKPLHLQEWRADSPITIMQNQTNNHKYPTPCNHRVLCQVIPPSGDQQIVLPDTVTDPNGSVVVRAVAADVTCCKPGDTVVLMPSVQPIGYDKSRNLIFVHDSHIVAVEPEIITEK